MADDKMNIEIGAKIDALKKSVDKGLAEFKRLGQGAKRLAIATTFLVAFRKIRNAISETITRLDALGKAARSIGVNSEAFQKLAFAARRNNMDLGRFSQAFQKMQRTVDDANDGLATQQLIFKKLGLEYKELFALAPEKQFDAIAKALVKQTNATQRASLANKIFGRAGRSVLNMARDYKEIGKLMQDKGLIISDEAVEQAEQAKDAIENMKTSLLALVGNSGVIGRVTTAMEELLKVMAMLQLAFNGLDAENMNKIMMGLLNIGGGVEDPTFWQKHLMDSLQGDAEKEQRARKRQARKELAALEADAANDAMFTIENRMKAEGKDPLGSDYAEFERRSARILDNQLERGTANWVKKSKELSRIINEPTVNLFPTREGRGRTKMTDPITKEEIEDARKRRFPGGGGGGTGTSPSPLQALYRDQALAIGGFAARAPQMTQIDTVSKLESIRSVLEDIESNTHILQEAQQDYLRNYQGDRFTDGVPV